MSQHINIFSENELHLLKTPNDMKAGLDLLLRIAIEFFLWFFIIISIKSSSWVTVSGLFFIVSTWHSFWGYAGLSHELFHGNVFSRKIINRQALHIANALTWTNGIFFKNSHILHHSKTFDANDTEALSMQPWSLSAILRYIFVDYNMLYNRISYAIKNAFGYITDSTLTSPEARSARNIAIWILTFNTTMQVVLFIFFENAIVNILFFLMPFSAQITNRMLAQSQHIGLSAQKNDGPLFHSRSIQLPFILKFLYAGMNYHCEHHLYPMIPYYNLPLVQKKLISRKIVFNHIKSFDFFRTEFWRLVK